MKIKMETIIGQEELVKKTEKVLRIFATSEVKDECKICPHFILTGSSGTGKSLIIQTMSKKYKLGFVEINAAQLTREGTSGNSLAKALSPILNYQSVPTVVFVDEFDKLFISGNSNSDSAHEATTAVQNEFLKVLEGNTTSVFHDYGKYVSVSVKKLLFVFAGAFNGEQDITIDRLRELGLKTEFLGRVGLVFNTEPLTLNHLYEIVDNSNLLHQYCNLFADQSFKKVSGIIKDYLRLHFETNTLGARIINTLIHQYFIDGKLEPKQVEKTMFQTKLVL